MQSQIDRKTMVCPLNGEVCEGGARKDFPENPMTGQKLTCRWWSHITGKDPQSEKLLDHFDCAVAWTPVLLCEGSQMTRQAAASVDKVANEVRRQHATFIGVLPKEAMDRLMESNPRLLEEHRGPDGHS